jgi:hypothetical protein
MPDANDKAPEDPRFTGGIALLERTGMIEFQLRWQDDNDPCVWLAVAQYFIGRDGRPQPQRTSGTKIGYRVGSALSPLGAVMNLCERVIDGGACTHCRRPTMFHPDLDLEPTPLDPAFCMYEWDPELKVYRRGCEGDEEIPGDVPHCAGPSALSHPRAPMTAVDGKTDEWVCQVCGTRMRSKDSD